MPWWVRGSKIVSDFPKWGPRVRNYGGIPKREVARATFSGGCMHTRIKHWAAFVISGVQRKCTVHSLTL